MMRINRRIITVLLSLLMVLSGTVVGVKSATFSVKAESVYSIPFENANVIDDLKGSTIEGVDFKLVK